MAYVLPLIADQWYYLGLQLLDSKYAMTLDTIEADTRNDNRLGGRKMFSKWLKTDKLASWEKLVEALTLIDLDNAAREIKQLLREGKPVFNFGSNIDCIEMIQRRAGSKVGLLELWLS